MFDYRLTAPSLTRPLFGAFFIGASEITMTTENATQPGAFESGSSARSNALQEIAKRVHNEKAEEFNSFNEETGEIAGKAEAQPEEAEKLLQRTGNTFVEQQPAAQEEGAETQTAQVQQPVDDLETIVIDGQERKVKRDQIIEAGRRTLQKESAADKRLEEAAETLRRVKAMEQALLRGQPSSDAGEESEQASSDPANGAARETTQNRATPDLGTLVDERLWLRDADKAAQRFKEEFKDIADDPLAARLVAQLENERLAKLAEEGQPVTSADPWEAYKAHGAKVREWLGKAKPTGQVEVSRDKAERKRDTVTVTGSTTSRPQPTQAKQPTTGERIEQMRIARMGKAIPISR